MDFVNSIILGIVQGLTEFIPVSSSGHLIIARDILGLQLSHSLAFDAVLQLATTLAVLVYFRKDIWGYIKTFFKIISGKSKEIEKKEKTLLYAVILGTIPAVIIGLLLEESMETIFRNPTLVAGSLIFGAVLMWWAEAVSKRKRDLGVKDDDSLSTKRGFGVGFFQALALIPGFSRSGMTITGGLFLGLNRVEATRFSFLLAFPVLFGSGIKKLMDLGGSGLLESVGGPLLVGSIVSFIVGLAAIHFLVGYLKKHTLNAFVVYRIILAVVVLIFI